MFENRNAPLSSGWLATAVLIAAHNEEPVIGATLGFSGGDRAPDRGTDGRVVH